VTKVWRKSSSGPDWTDNRIFMKELMILHCCAVYLEILPGSTRDGPFMRLVLSAVSNTPGSDLKVCEEAVSGQWPSNRGVTMEGEVYGLCVRLDRVLSEKWWKQGVFELP